MTTKLPLSSLEVGTSCVIDSIHSKGTMRRRLLDLGFCEGSRVKCIQYSPAGDPIAYMIRGTVIALRKEDAQNIIVSKGGDLWD